MTGSMAAAAAVTLPRELVLASAGTGKTFRISSRIIGLLAAGVPADSIFASTFTRKAAGEILDRVLERMAAAALDERAASELAVHARLADGVTPPSSSGDWLWLLRRTISDLHRLNVGTLDAFFVRTATSFADEVALPAGWTIADETMNRRALADAVHEVLEHADRGEVLEMVRGLTTREAGRSVHDAVLGKARDLILLHHALDPEAADPWMGLAAHLGPKPADFEARCEDVAARLEALPPELNRNGSVKGQWVAGVGTAAAQIRTGQWDTFIKSTICKNSWLDEPHFYGVDMSAELFGLLEEACGLAKFALGERLARQGAATGRLAARLAEAADRARRARGAFDFADVTRLLGGPGALCAREDLHYRLDARVRHILLDEFQDTSLAQWEALEPLVDELLSGHAEERAAVVVADPKQSIYGWRGAEPQLVEHIGASYALNRDDLALSWRSSQVVLDLVNDLFGALEENGRLAGDAVPTRVAEDWRRAFRTHRAARQLPGHVRIVAGPDDDNGRSETLPLLCGHAADLVAELRRESPGMSIGVLTRKNATVARMIMELRARGVDASEEGGNPLTDSRAVAGVLALLRLADHPGDSIARYHVAMTPVGEVVGYTDYEDGVGARRVAERLRRRLLEDGYGRTLTALAAGLRTSCGVRDRRRLTQLAELGFRHDSAARLRTIDFINLVETERVEDPTAAEVRVMTVHQSKGLEFDIVVLPELDVPLVRVIGAPLLPYRPHPAGRITRVFPPVKADLRPLFEDVPELVAAMEQGAAARWRDSFSALYVALTRARHALHLVVKPDQANKKTGERSMSKACTAATLLRDRFAPGVVAEPGMVLLERGDSGWYRGMGGEVGPEVSSVAGVAGSAVAPTITLAPSKGRKVLGQVAPSALAGGASIDVRPLLRLDMAAAERGTVAHAWFEQVGWVEEGVPTSTELEEIGRQVAPHLAPDVRADLEQRFQGWIRTPAVRHALSRDAYPAGATVEREISFVHRDDGRLLEGVIDRLVLVHEGGRVVRAEVIDFKTDAIRSGDQAALDARTAYYLPQIEAYRQVVRSWYRLPADRVAARLVFVEAAAVLEVPPV